MTPWFHGLLAETESAGSRADLALESINKGLEIGEETGDQFADSYLHRKRGDILLQRDAANAAPAEDAYRTAIAIAQKQGARTYELRAALALAKLYQSTARPAEAHATLAPALEGFSPTPEMPEIAQAQALLAALARTEEVKAAEAQRQRRAQLHVAYGNALIATRGYGAPETTEAFAIARESTASDNANPERLAANYGLWVGSYIHGELPSMRLRAAEFLGDVTAGLDSPEASVAHRVLGITHWFAGDYADAHDHLERALELFQPGRDDDLSFRFGQDVGVAAMLWSALTLWPLGQVERAASLVGDAQARMAELTHVQTRMFGKLHAALFALMRGDISQTNSNVSELAHLARESDLDFFSPQGAVLDGWVKAQSGISADGLEEMRRGVGLLREKKVRVFDGLFKARLAEGEGRAGDLGRALAILDEALGTSERIGHRTFDAEVHRARGEMLLKSDPANPALAEEALQTAIAVAKQQGTRSFELLASLSLAKLYQSISRPADAYAVLAPALEDFAPTPEMPEIAKAQALMEGLA